MIPAVLQEREESRGATPHLSYSRINRYLHCPEQYRLYDVERLRPRRLSANLAFGKVVHLALAKLLTDGTDPVQVFRETWDEAKDVDLAYAHRESWETLQARGVALLEKFLAEELGKIGAIHASEKPFAVSVTSLGLPFVGVIDLVAGIQGKRTVVDFKTSSTKYEEHEVALSDQLTAYQLAEPDAEQSALCVFVKTKEPRIEWHVAARSGSQLVEFLDKADLVAREIAANRFYKRPGKWCSYCDFLPVCLGDEKRIRATLVQLP